MKKFLLGLADEIAAVQPAHQGAGIEGGRRRRSYRDITRRAEAVLCGHVQPQRGCSKLAPEPIRKLKR